MNAPAVAANDAIETDGWRNIGVTALLLSLGLASLGLLFRPEAETAVSTWEASTAYNHCFLIIPIVLYILWDRRDELRGMRAEPMPMAALLGIPPAGAWLLAERLGIMEGRQLMVVAFVEVLFLSVLGWRLFKAMLGPMLYLFFLVPFGEFLVPKLQDFTAEFIRFGMSLTSIPAYIDGYTIEIPEGRFYVAEACAGLRFLIASIAFGVLYALMMYRSPMRRTIFIVISIIVPIIANGFRALGIVLAGHYLGSAEAAAADHVLYGWIFFSIVILLLTAMGLPFREDLGPRKPRPTEIEAGMLPMIPGFAAVAAAVAVAAASPAAALGLERLGASRPLTPVALDPPSMCLMMRAPDIIERPAGGRLLVMRMVCGGAEYDLALETFSSRGTSGPVLAERRRVTRPKPSENISELPINDAADRDSLWRLVRSTEPHHLAAARVWIEGEPMNAGMRMRIIQAKASLFGSNQVPALLIVQPRMDFEAASYEQRVEAEQRLKAFVLALPDLDARMRAMTRLPD